MYKLYFKNYNKEEKMAQVKKAKKESFSSSSNLWKEIFRLFFSHRSLHAASFLFLVAS